MERLEEQPNQRAALRTAFPATIPVLTGYACLGLAYGLLMEANGYGPLWSALMSAIGFGGSMQYVAITLLDYSYWIIATALGGLLGRFLTFDTTGLDFALTALFVVLFLEQWKKKENRAAGAIGLACAAVSLAVFGPDNMVIAAMALILAVLLGGRKPLCT